MSSIFIITLRYPCLLSCLTYRKSPFSFSAYLIECMLSNVSERLTYVTELSSFQHELYFFGAFQSNRSVFDPKVSFSPLERQHRSVISNTLDINNIFKANKFLFNVNELQNDTFTQKYGLKSPLILKFDYGFSAKTSRMVYFEDKEKKRHRGERIFGTPPLLSIKSIQK